MIVATKKFAINIDFVIGMWKSYDEYMRSETLVKIYELNIAYTSDRMMRIEFDNEAERDEAFELVLESVK